MGKHNEPPAAHKGPVHSHEHHKKMAHHHHKEMKKHIDGLHKLAKAHHHKEK